MQGIDTLIKRIDQELSTEVKHAERSAEENARLTREREQRVQQYEAVAKHIIDLVKPRLVAFVDRFKALAKAEPSVRSHTRALNLKFHSFIASVGLRFEVYPDPDARNVRLECEQQIIPVLFKYEKHSLVEFPLDAVKDDAVVQWFDDR